MTKKTLCRAVSICKSQNAEYDARFVLSASTPDRVKDTIDPAAYTPYVGERLIALWQHNSDNPVGVWENLRTESKKLIGDLKLSGTRLADMIRQLLADEIPLGASISFMGQGEPNKEGGFNFKSIELLECSIVSVPAHPRAVQIAKQYGLVLTSTEGLPLAMSGDHLTQRHRAALAICAAKRALKGR